jgi:urea transporter
MFFVADSWALFRYAIMASAFTAVVHGAVVSFMAPFGLPGYTFPFNVVAWIFCLAGKTMSNLMPVEISKMSTPEQHMDRLRLCHKLIKLIK